MMKPTHIIQFLGKRIAMQDGPNKYKMFILYGILANGLAIIGNSKGEFQLVEWSILENSYMIVDQIDIEVEYQ